jgi:hypothetical protein
MRARRFIASRLDAQSTGEDLILFRYNLFPQKRGYELAGGIAPIYRND